MLKPNEQIDLLIKWHQGGVEMLKHMKTIPEGSEAETDDGTVLVLKEDALKGYRLGIELALIELGTLPFSPTSETLQ